MQLSAAVNAFRVNGEKNLSDDAETILSSLPTAEKYAICDV